MFGKKNWKETVIMINGMHCAMCSSRMRKAFEDAKGVREAEVDLENKSARVVFDADKLTEEDLKTIVRETGYTPV
ncbi:heavy-metal-associated domain-containing protein [Neglectibacter caecimuris]|uniref:heavy-metal-associated domain-containing protein n=1 Tax=Neglectibacter caecimuris TaxID=3093658 RepID=UPI002AC98349|nr:heavy-metal-associated domain-containing protein [Neglectibacter sp. M00184]